MFVCSICLFVWFLVFVAFLAMFVCGIFSLFGFTVFVVVCFSLFVALICLFSLCVFVFSFLVHLFACCLRMFVAFVWWLMGWQSWQTKGAKFLMNSNVVTFVLEECRLQMYSYEYWCRLYIAEVCLKWKIWHISQRPISCHIQQPLNVTIVTFYTSHWFGWSCLYMSV